MQERRGEAGLELEHGRAGGRAAQGRAEVRLGLRGRRPRLGEARRLHLQLLIYNSSLVGCSFDDIIFNNSDKSAVMI